MKNIVIIGAADLGKEIVWLIEDINKLKPTYLILGFLDDTESKWGKQFCWYNVLGGIEKLDELSKNSSISAVIAVKDPIGRKKIVEEHPAFHNWETIIHPNTVVAASSTVGEGSILFPYVTVSVDSKLGRFGLYYIQSTISDDCRIGDFVTTMCGTTILEHVQIEDECLFYPRSLIQGDSIIEKGTRYLPDGRE